MIDIVVSISEKEYPFFMKLVKNFDFVTIKESKQITPAKQGKHADGSQQVPVKILSPALEGGPISNFEFKDWIEQAEAMPTITLQQAKNKWANKRKQLQQPIK